MDNGPTGLKAPKGGVLIHYAKGKGWEDLVIKTDPPLEDRAAIKRALEELADTLERLKV